jgi:hypothetical protein
MNSPQGPGLWSLVPSLNITRKTREKAGLCELLGVFREIGNSPLHEGNASFTQSFSSPLATMKRKREQEQSFFDDENKRCHLLETVREMRAHICSFLVPDPADLAHLAQTCKVFETQLVCEQTGLLYYPWHWRNYFEFACRSLGGFSRKRVKDFLIAKALLHVFDGLKGGQSLVKVRLETTMSTATFLLGSGNHACKFVFSPTDTVYPTPKAIAALKEAIHARHAAKLANARHNRKIPQEVRKERAQLKQERSALKRTLVDLARKMRGYSCEGPHKLPAYIKISQRFVDAGKRHLEVVARLEEIADLAGEEEEGEEEADDN